MVAEGRGRREEVFALFLQIGRDPRDGVKDLPLAELGARRRGRFRAGDFLFERRVVFAQGRGGLDGFSQDITLAETGQIVGGKTQAKLIGGTMRAEQLQLRVAQFGIHLDDSDSIVGVFPRIHRTTPEAIWNGAGAQL